MIRIEVLQNLCGIEASLVTETSGTQGLLRSSDHDVVMIEFVLGNGDWAGSFARAMSSELKSDSIPFVSMAVMTTK